jgi:hypothetical protein
LNVDRKDTLDLVSLTGELSTEWPAEKNETQKNEEEAGKRAALAPARLQAEAVVNQEQRVVDGQVRLQQIHPHAILGVLPPLPVSIKGMMANLEIHFHADASENRQGLTARLQTGEGMLTLPAVFKAPVEIKELTAEADFPGNLLSASRAKATVVFRDTVLDATGSYQVTPATESTPTDYDATVALKLGKLPVPLLDLYWPEPVAPRTKQVVQTYVKDGMVESAAATLRFRPEYFANRRFPEEAVDTKIQVSDATIFYLPDYPLVKKVDGTVTISGNGLHIAINRGTMLEATEVTNGTLAIPSFYNKPLLLEVDAGVKAPLSDVAEFLESPHLQLRDTVGIGQTDPEGIAEGKVSLKAYTMKREDLKTLYPDLVPLEYKVEATLADASHPELFGMLPVENGKGSLKVNNKEVDIRLEYSAQERAALLAVHSAARKPSDTAPRETDFQLKFPLSHERAIALGYQVPHWLGGEIFLDVQGTRAGESLTVSGQADLEDALLEIPYIDWQKPAGEQANLAFRNLTRDSEALKIAEMELETPDIKAEGDLEIDLKAKRLRKLTLGKIQGKDYEGRMELGFKNHTLSLEIEAGKLNLAPTQKWLDEQLKKEDEAGKQDYSLHLNIHSQLAKFRGGGSVRDMVLEARCTPDYCDDTVFRGTLRDKAKSTFHAMIDRGGDDPDMVITSNNAGIFLKTLDIYPNLRGGELYLSGDYEQSFADSPLKGKLEIRNFTLQKAPLLTRLVTLASIQGILDLLGGNGISFDTLDAPFSYHKGKIALDYSTMLGGPLGLTSEGTIDHYRETLNLSGSLAPAYTLNSLLSNIPILGEALAGGKDEALFAATYTMEGSLENPDVNVNPLSMLTPGFLRQLFRVPDKERESLPKN